MGGEDLLLFILGDVGVYLGGGDGAVAQQLLDIADIDAFFQEQGGKGVPERMRGNRLFDAGSAGITINHEADGLLG